MAHTYKRKLQSGKTIVVKNGHKSKSAFDSGREWSERHPKTTKGAKIAGKATYNVGKSIYIAEGAYKGGMKRAFIRLGTVTAGETIVKAVYQDHQRKKHKEPGANHVWNQKRPKARGV